MHVLEDLAESFILADSLGRGVHHSAVHIQLFGDLSVWDFYMTRYNASLIVDLEAPLQDESDDLLLSRKPLELG